MIRTSLLIFLLVFPIVKCIGIVFAQTNCTDSDFDDTSIPSITYNMTETRFDICSDSKLIQEHTCVNNSIRTYTYLCPSDSICLDGACEVRDSSLILGMHFSNNTQPVFDFSQNGNNGITNALWTKDGKAGGAYIFYGNTEIKVNKSPSLSNITSAMTLEAWIYVNNFTNYSIILGSTSRYLLVFSRGYINFLVFSGIINFSSITSPPITSNRWYHVVATFDTQELRIYLNGQLVNLTNSNISSLFEYPANLTIGKFFIGKIDEVRIYNRSLSEKEVLSHYCLLDKNATICTPRAIITLETTKKRYSIGENVLLTDPPEPSNQSNIEYEEDVTFLGTPISIIEKDERPMFVTNEIVVKFKDNPNVKSPHPLLRALTGSPKITTKFGSINNLNKKYSIRNAKKMFSDFDRKATFQKYNEIKQKFPNRSRRISNPEIPKLENIYIFEYDRIDDIEKIINDYENDPNVEYAEPNYIYYPDIEPDDPKYILLWNLKKIMANYAWNITKGSSNVVVAVVDTGVNYLHPDLANNIWVNPGEDLNNNGIVDDTDFNGIDDDNNSYIDDIRGWDFIQNDNDPMPNPSDKGAFHGTHVAGTIGAVGNNSFGVTGVNWVVKIMPVRVLGPVGIIYAANNGADVISCSWGDTNIPSNVLKDAIKWANALGAVVVVSAGNDNFDVGCHTPANIEKAITVGSSTSEDTKSKFSNYGPKIDVVAPGEYILSTYSEDSYGILSGTSMATPHVSGLAALLLAQNPNLTSEKIRQILRKSSTDIMMPGWDIYTGYGRINASRALVMSNYSCEANIVYPDTNFISYTLTNCEAGILLENEIIKINGTANSTNFLKYCFEYGLGDNPASWKILGCWNYSVIDGNLGQFNISKLDPNGTYNGKITIRLRVYNQSGYEYCEDRAIIEIVKAKITWPFDNALIVPRSVSYPSNYEYIEGFARTRDTSLFNKYELFYSHDSKPSKWTFLYKNTSPVNGVWEQPYNITPGILLSNLTIIPNGNVTIKLIVTDKNNNSFEDNVSIYFDSIHFPYKFDPIPVANILLNYPQTIASPVLYDINNDNNMEIILLTFEGLKVYNYTGGLFWSESNCNLTNSPAVGDVNGDGNVEIGCVAKNGTFYLYNHNGTLAWSDNVDYQNGSIVFEDIDNNGILDIIYARINGSLIVYNGTGYILPGFPVQVNSNFTSTPLVADLDNDGYMEIVVRGNINLYIFDHNGNLLKNFSTAISYTSPILGDVDGDGNIEIIDFPRNIIKIYNYTGFEKNFSLPAQGKIRSKSLGDINGDGIPEIILYYFGSNESGYIFKLYAFNYSGVMDGWPIDIPSDLSGDILIGDIDGDEEMEILISSYAGIHVGFIYGLDSNGKIMKGDEWPIRKWAYSQNSIAISDIDLDGKCEIVLHGYFGGTVNKEILYVWTLPYKCGIMEWPMFMHNARHTGVYTKKSVIRNIGPVKIDGLIYIAVEKNVNGTWQTIKVLKNNTLVKIPVNSHIGLDSIWNNSGGYIANESGEFRVMVRLTIYRPNLPQITLSNNYNFMVV